MTPGKEEKPVPDDPLAMLDSLIGMAYKALSEHDKEINVTLGDFLKMLELRNKVAPVGSGQKEFWKLIERIRRQAMAEPVEDTNRKKSGRQKNDK